MNWLKSWLLTILQKVFPSEKPDYQELQAWAREQVVHPIYSVELDCYRHGFPPVALEERSIGVWACPLCSAPKPAVWYDEVSREQIHAYIPPEPRTEKPKIIPDARGRYFQTRRREFETTRLMPAAPRLARILDEPPSHSLTAPEDDWTNGNADKTKHRMKAV